MRKRINISAIKIPLSDVRPRIEVLENIKPKKKLA